VCAALFALLVGAPGSSRAGFILIDFENIPPFGTVDSFGHMFPGLTLASNNQWVADEVSREFVHLHGRAISAFPVGNAPLSITFDSPVSDVGMDLGSSLRNGQITVGVTGYLGDQLVFMDNFVTLPGATGIEEVQAFTTGVVDRIVVARTGGTAIPVLDNLSYNTSAVPEPNSLVLLLIGLGSCGGLIARRVWTGR
jgi:hypothetical protein